MAWIGPAPAALIAHYPLDTINGTTTPDSTGGSGGTLNGTGITLAPGQLGGAFNFTGGTSQFVGIADPGFGQNTFTASVWFNPDTLDQGDPIANWTNAGPSPRTFLIRTNGGQLQTFVRDNGANQIGGSTGLIPVAGAWNHVAITYDGQTLRTFLDGSPSVTAPSFATARPIGEGVAGTAAIGGRGSSEQEMVGLVDDVAFWDEDLTATEIIGLFGVAAAPALNYDAAKFDLLKQVHDAGSGSVAIDGLIWEFRSGLTGPAGLSGTSLVLDTTAGPAW